MTNLNEECLLQFLQKGKQKTKAQEATVPEQSLLKNKSLKQRRDKGQGFMSFPGQQKPDETF